MILTESNCLNKTLLFDRPADLTQYIHVAYGMTRRTKDSFTKTTQQSKMMTEFTPVRFILMNGLYRSLSRQPTKIRLALPGCIHQMSNRLKICIPVSIL